MPLLVTSAAGANSNGYAALLAFDRDGRPLGAFSDDSRIADPRGLVVNGSEGLLFLNSGRDRVLAPAPRSIQTPLNRDNSRSELTLFHLAAYPPL